jgi:hypothetical protein
LDHVIMQVAGDPVPVLQQRDPLLVGAGVRQLQRDRGVICKGRHHFQVGCAEHVPAMQPSHHQRPARSTRADQRDRHRGAHRDQFGDLDDVVLLGRSVREQDRASALDRHPRHGLLRGVGKAGQTIGMLAGGHLHGQPLPLGVWKDDGHHVRLGQLVDAVGDNAQWLHDLGGEQLPRTSPEASSHA